MRLLTNLMATLHIRQTSVGRVYRMISIVIGQQELFDMLQMLLSALDHDRFINSRCRLQGSGGRIFDCIPFGDETLLR